MAESFVSILMGSDSDWPIMQVTAKTLEAFNISTEIRITSAHRTPLDTTEYVKHAETRGCQVFIAAAGLAAHLAGTVAAHTIKPVIGVPLDTGSLQGLDALLSTVQMPGGVPVACVAIGAAGAKNAAYLAIQILAVHNAKLAEQLRSNRQTIAQQVRDKNQTLDWQ